ILTASLDAHSHILHLHVDGRAYGMAPELKLRGMIGKRVLRRAVADLVPPRIRRRVKRGLSVPLATWFAGPLRPFVRETLARLDPHVVRPAAVRTLFEDHVERRRDNR